MRNIVFCIPVLGATGASNHLGATVAKDAKRKITGLLRSDTPFDGHKIDYILQFYCQRKSLIYAQWGTVVNLLCHFDWVRIVETIEFNPLGNRRAQITQSL